MTSRRHKHATLAHAGKSTTPSKAVVISRNNNQNEKSASDEDIRRSAYQKWEAAGKPTGDGIKFWLEAEQELVKGKNEKLFEGGAGPGHREHERPATVKERNVSVDSHYKDNNRMFQSHGERGHRHGSG